MPRYKCTNKDCEMYNKEVQQSSTTKIVEGKLIDSAIKCNQCGGDRGLIVAEGMTTYMSGGENVCKR